MLNSSRRPSLACRLLVTSSHADIPRRGLMPGIQSANGLVPRRSGRIPVSDRGCPEDLDELWEDLHGVGPFDVPPGVDHVLSNRGSH